MPMAKSRTLTVREPVSLDTSKRRRYPNRALTEAEIRLFLTSIESVRDDALIRLGLSAGLRVSEVVTIRTSEIDFDHGLIKIWMRRKTAGATLCPLWKQWAFSSATSIRSTAA